MAVGLVVRVPFSDHRLVEYVHNTPWSLKTFAGKEKSLLRAATRGVLPESVAESKKGPYRQTQNPAHLRALISQGAGPGCRSSTFDLVDRRKLDVVTRGGEAARRGRLAAPREVLSPTTWLDLYQPGILAA